MSSLTLVHKVDVLSKWPYPPRSQTRQALGVMLPSVYGMVVVGKFNGTAAGHTLVEAKVLLSEDPHQLLLLVVLLPPFLTLLLLVPVPPVVEEEPVPGLVHYRLCKVPHE